MYDTLTDSSGITDRLTYEIVVKAKVLIQDEEIDSILNAITVTVGKCEIDTLNTFYNSYDVWPLTIQTR